MPYTEMIEQRLRFLEIDEDVIADLHKAKQILEPEMDGMLDAFYSRISAEPQLKELFADDDSMARAKQAQKNHWLKSLLAGEFTSDHFARAEIIGRAHARVGLTPNWYIGGYSNMLAQFIQHILDQEPEEGRNTSAVIEALCKAVLLDVDLVIHSYLEAKDRLILDLLMDATRFIDDLDETNAALRVASEKVRQSAEALSQEASADDEQANPVEVLLAHAKVLTDKVQQMDMRIDQLKSSERLYLKRGSEHTGTFSQLVSQVIEN